MNENEERGKCSKCKVQYAWPASAGVSLKDAYCPKCGQKLRVAPRFLRWPLAREVPAIAVVDSMRGPR